MSEPAWCSLLRRAFELIDQAERSVGEPIEWSFGGGTVLMLRMNHRHSKDVDIFLADQQVLGFFNPRVSDAAQGMTTAYDESAGHVKLYLAEGEIDFVVANPLLKDPFESIALLDRAVVLERSSEIVAKKMWHRGNLATARDLFDLAAVNVHDPGAIEEASPFFSRHAHAFLQQISARQAVMRAGFDAIDRREFALTFDECQEIAESILRPLLAAHAEN